MIRAFVTLIGVLAITACTPISTPTRSVSLGQGEVIAMSPDGYCIDPVSSQPAKDFAILAPCVTMGSDDAVPDVVGVATVQVGPVESGTVAADELALRDFLLTDDGVRLLSQTGDADAIDVLSSQTSDSQVLIHFADDGPPPLAGLQREEWRAFANVNGRLVTIGVRGLAAAPLQEEPGAALLKLILAGVQAATAATEETTPDV